MKYFITLLLLIVFINITDAQKSSAHENEKVCVLGNVVKPSCLTFREGMTITQAIEESAGIKWHKRDVKVLLRRLILGGKGDRNIIELNLTSIQKGKSENLVLQPYDVVQVICPKKKHCFNGFMPVIY